MKRFLVPWLILSLVVAPITWGSDDAPAILADVAEDAVPMDDDAMMQVRGAGNAALAAFAAQLPCEVAQMILVYLILMWQPCPTCYEYNHIDL